MQDTKLHSVTNRKLIRSDSDRWTIEEDQIMDPKTIEIDAIYTPWTNWSRCKRKCKGKQMRKRYCKIPAICGSNVLKVSFYQIFFDHFEAFLEQFMSIFLHFKAFLERFDHF